MKEEPGYREDGVKKNILLITQSLTGGGAEKVVANLSVALSAYANIYIVSYDETENEFAYSGRRINIGIPGGDVPLATKIVNAIKRIVKIRKIKRQYDIDCSISFIPQTDYANIFSKRKKEKCVIEISSNMSGAFPSGIAKAIRRFIIDQADLIITVSKGAKRDLIHNFGIKQSKVETIYNLMDLEDISSKLGQSTDTESRIKTATKYIVTAGSFRKPKGHWHLIKAFSTIYNSIPDYSLVILGDGEYRDQYIELIKRLKIPQDKVIMPGFMHNPYPIIANSELFVFSSVYEGFGNVIIEAMKCNVPVVSTDCNYGPREIIAPETDYLYKTDKIDIAEYGWLVPSFGLEDIDVTDEVADYEKLMGKAILQLLADREECDRLRKAGLERSEHFGLENISRQWCRILNL